MPQETGLLQEDFSAADPEAGLAGLVAAIGADLPCGRKPKSRARMAVTSSMGSTEEDEGGDGIVLSGGRLAVEGTGRDGTDRGVRVGRRFDGGGTSTCKWQGAEAKMSVRGPAK